ncbi:MAG: hypothetical protein WBQ61_03645 [Candidatus Acidiferrum sp.]
MANNAQLIFDSLNKYADIHSLLGKQEDIFLDFKETKTTRGVCSMTTKCISARPRADSRTKKEEW